MHTHNKASSLVISTLPTAALREMRKNASAWYRVSKRLVVSKDLGWDLVDFPEDMTLDDKEVLASCIALINGTARASMETGNTDKLKEQMAVELSTALERGLERLSDNGAEALSGITDQLRYQIAALTYGGVNPFDIGRFWADQFTQYTDVEFARLARTESAFALIPAKMSSLRDEYGADDSVLEMLGAIPPIHPNCMCDVQPMNMGDMVYLYLDTTMEPCMVCNALAEQVMDEIMARGA